MVWKIVGHLALGTRLICRNDTRDPTLIWGEVRTDSATLSSDLHVSAPWRQRDLCEFKASLFYISSSRPSRERSCLKQNKTASEHPQLTGEEQ